MRNKGTDICAFGWCRSAERKWCGEGISAPAGVNHGRFFPKGRARGSVNTPYWHLHRCDMSNSALFTTRLSHIPCVLLYRTHAWSKVTERKRAERRKKTEEWEDKRSWSAGTRRTLIHRFPTFYPEGRNSHTHIYKQWGECATGCCSRSRSCFLPFYQSAARLQVQRNNFPRRFFQQLNSSLLFG